MVYKKSDSACDFNMTQAIQTKWLNKNKKISLQNIDAALLLSFPSQDFFFF